MRVPVQAQARMIFAEGDDPRVLRAAVMYQRSGFGKALVVGREVMTSNSG